MENCADQPIEANPGLSSSGSQHASDTIQVEHLQNPPGEGDYHCEDSHTLFMSLVPRPIYYVQTQDGKTHADVYQKGELLITPVNTPLYVKWEGHESCLQIQLDAEYIKRVAQETMANGGDRLQLLPTFQARDPQLEAIANLILTEHQQQQSGNRLYLDSLANVLAVNLLRQHATTKPQVPVYEGGLPLRQLQQVLDYIDAHLDQEIKLATLAQLIDMSQFHFSRLFKQSLGLSPHKYLLQQRVERAKLLLKQTDQPIINIALECGFGSHSHLSKHFRQLTGTTPKAYRAI